MTRRAAVPATQRGLTLVELLVSLVLGLVLMIGVLQLFGANRASYQLTDAISTMQENARYAMTRLERDIRMAGFLGCTGRDQGAIAVNVEFDTSSLPEFTPGNGLEGWDADGTGYGTFTLEAANVAVEDASGSGWSTSSSAPLSAVLDGDTDSVPNSDVLRVWHVDGDGVLAEMTGNTLEASATPPYGDGDTVMLTDCTSVDLVHACSGGTSVDLSCADNSPLNLLNATGAAHAFKFAGWVYFVGKRDDDAANPPALFRREISQDAQAGLAQELVEGVEALQLLYGEDTTGDPDGIADRYVTADNVADWNNVVSVQVQMLMQSRREDLVDGSQSFAFNGATVTASDGRLRYPFSATVSVRNRSR